MVDGGCQLSRRCLTRCFAVLVERRVVGEMAIFGNHHHLVTASTHYPIRSSSSFRPHLPTSYPTLVAYNTQLLASPSTANPIPLPCNYRYQTNPANQHPPIHSSNSSSFNTPTSARLTHYPIRFSTPTPHVLLHKKNLILFSPSCHLLSLRRRVPQPPLPQPNRLPRVPNHRPLPHSISTHRSLIP